MQSASTKCAAHSFFFYQFLCRAENFAAELHNYSLVVFIKQRLAYARVYIKQIT